MQVHPRFSHPRHAPRHRVGARPRRRLNPIAAPGSSRGCGSWLRTEVGSSRCSEGQSVRSATLSMVLKVVTDKGKMSLGLRAPGAGRLFDQGLIEAAAAREQRAERRPVGQQRPEGDVPPFLLVGGQRRVGLGHVGEELGVLRVGGRRCPQRRGGPGRRGRGRRRARRRSRPRGRSGRWPRRRCRRARRARGQRCGATALKWPPHRQCGTRPPDVSSAAGRTRTKDKLCHPDDTRPPCRAGTTPPGTAL